MSSVPVFLTFFIGATAYALVRGGAPEKVTAGALVLGLAGSSMVGFMRVPGDFRVVPMGLFMVDILLLVALTGLALVANRYWPIVMAGCQLDAVLVHACKLLNPGMIPQSYVLLITIWSWPMTGLLVLGTWSNHRGVRRGSFKASWKHS